MSDLNAKSSAENKSKVDPLQRLPSFKAPRDLTLGAAKPNKKIFTPNLNVTRNKNKSTQGSTSKEPKKDVDKGKNHRGNDKKRNNRHLLNIVKTAGVFSEGIGTLERRPSSRTSYGRDTASTSSERPTLRVKEAWKIDKELDDKKLKYSMDNEGLDSDDDNEPEDFAGCDAPIQLPIVNLGLNIKKKVKEELVVKQEPMEEDGDSQPSIKTEITKEEDIEDTDFLTALKSDKTTFMLVQLPDSLPGCGGRSNKSSTSQEGNNEDSNKADDERCFLSDLEEGHIGKLMVHKSGKVRMQLGSTMFDVCMGTKPSYKQEVISILQDDDKKTAQVVSLGHIQNKLIAVPDWETLFKDITI